MASGSIEPDPTSAEIRDPDPDLNEIKAVTQRSFDTLPCQGLLGANRTERSWPRCKSSEEGRKRRNHNPARGREPERWDDYRQSRREKVQSSKSNLDRVRVQMRTKVWKRARERESKRKKKWISHCRSILYSHSL